MRALLVEDDDMIGRSLVHALKGAGWSVDWVRDGALAHSALADGDYRCVLLDLGLPGLDGTEVLRRARARGDLTPVLVLTARDGLDDRIQGLDLGADDYLLKPFEVGELLARMRAVVRRRSGVAQSVVGNGVVQLDLATREVLRGGAREALTAREFALLWELMTPPGRVLSKSELSARLSDAGEALGENALEASFSRLRRKLAGSGAAIRTLRGLGYLLEDEG